MNAPFLASISGIVKL